MRSMYHYIMSNYHYRLALENIKLEDYDTALVHSKLWLHSKLVKHTFVTNGHQILADDLDKYFFKLYWLDPHKSKYEFIDYGWYHNKRFVTWKSYICWFEILSEKDQITLSNSSTTHIIVSTDSNIYLLQNPDGQVCMKFLADTHRR